MTSCSEVVPSVIWQRPGISSGGLWERNKPFNYSSEVSSPLCVLSFCLTLPCADEGSEAVKCCCSGCSARVAMIGGRAEWWLGPLPCQMPCFEAQDHGSLVCKQTDAGSAPHLLLCQVYWLNLCCCRKPFGVTSLAEHRSREKGPGGNHHSTGTHREDVKLLQHFCSKCLILDWHVTNNIPCFYLVHKNLLLSGIKMGLCD